MSAIADLIIEIGRARAQGAAQQGHIWGSALANIGQIPGQVMQQRRQEQRDVMAQQELNARLRLQGQESELNQQRFAAGEQTLASGRQAVAQQSAVDAVYAATIGDDGLPDMAKVQQVLAASGQTHLLPIIREQRNKWAASDEALTASKTTAREAAMKLEAEQRDALGADGAALAAAQYDPGLFGIRVSMLAKQGRVPTEQADAWIHQAEQDPASVRSIVDQWVAGSKTQQTLIHTRTQAEKLQREMQGNVPPTVAQTETARHNQELERIAALTEGRTEAGQRETVRHNRAIEAAPRPAGTAGALSDEGVEFAATQYRVTGTMPPLGQGNTQARTAIINAAARQARDLRQSPVASIQKQAAFKADRTALTKMTSMEAAAGAFETKAIAQADIVAELSNSVDRSQFPLLNRALLAGNRDLLGDTNTQLLFNAITTFTAEYAKIMEGSTGSAAASSDAARVASARLIPASLNKETLTRTIELMRREMRLSIQGYEATIDHITTRMGGLPSPSAPIAEPPPASAPQEWIRDASGNYMPKPKSGR